tara:strand:+ start:1607 stop:2545 length:939 start_codon:yes stop_codon:yes gene_type:complete
MAEVSVMDDPALDSGQSDAAPSNDTLTSEMGMGFVEPEIVAGDLSPSEGQTDDATAAPPAPDNGQSTNNDSPADTQEQEAGYLRHQDYTRKTMDVAEERRQLQADREAFLKQQQEFQEAQRAQPQPQQGLTPTLSQQLRQSASSLELSEADRVGINVVAQLAETVEGLQQENRQLIQRLEGVEPQVHQLGQATQTLTQQNEAASQRQLQQQSQEAVELFGNEIVGNQRIEAFVAHNLNTSNPATGEPFTVAELVGIATGRSIDEARQGRQQTQGQRQQAKRQAHAGATPSSPAQSSGPISREQSLAEIAQTM